MPASGKQSMIYFLAAQRLVDADVEKGYHIDKFDEFSRRVDPAVIAQEGHYIRPILSDTTEQKVRVYHRQDQICRYNKQ